MKTGKLAAMANQIAGYFNSYPREQAEVGLANHIEKFWTPRMRDTLRQQALQGDPGLDRLVIAAMSGSAAEKATTPTLGA